MARPPRRGGRSTPKGARPTHLRPLPGGGGPGRQGADRSPLHDLIESGAHELFGDASAVAAETWASGLLRLLGDVADEAGRGGQPVPPLLEAVIEHCAERHDPDGAVVAAAVAAVAPPPYDRAARTVADRLVGIAGVPGWVRLIGQAAATRAFSASDPWGDQEHLIVAFRQPGEQGEHALVALVDHGLSGQAVDLWIAADADEAVARWREAEAHGMRVDELPIGVALARLRDAVAAAEFWDGDTDLRSDTFTGHRAMVWARLRRAGLDDGPPTPIEVPDDERDALVADFLAAPEGSALVTTVARTEAQLLASALVGLRADFEGRPLRWSPAVVIELLLDLIPRHILATDDQQHAVPEVVRAFVRYAGRRTGLADEHVAATLQAVDEAEAEFHELASEPDPPDAALDHDHDHAPAAWPALPPTASAPPEVVASAAAAPVLASFAALAGFYGTGRKLTPNGHPTLADARALLELIGSDERLEEVYGATTVKHRSAGELPHLSFLLRWAVDAGVVRKQHGRLLATSSWTRLTPMARWARAVTELRDLGPVAGFYAGAPVRGRIEPLDDLAPDLLRRLVAGPLDAEALLAEVVDVTGRRYVWNAEHLRDPERRTTWMRPDLDRLLTLLGEAGVVDWQGAPGHDTVGWRPSTPLPGTVSLTPAGRWLLGG